MSGLVQTVTTNQVEQKSCSPAVVAISMIVALAVAIIGALALTGVLCPDTSLIALGNSIGYAGSIAMISSGCTLALLILGISICCNQRHESNRQTTTTV